MSSTKPLSNILTSALISCLIGSPELSCQQQEASINDGY